jgi:hypothetical protein
MLRAGQIFLLLLALLYIGDYCAARFHLPANRQTLGSVQVQTLWAVRLKNGNYDYSLGDTQTQTCVHSLFPQLGYTPCWYLSRHAKKRIEVGRVTLPASVGPVLSACSLLSALNRQPLHVDHL